MAIKATFSKGQPTNPAQTTIGVLRYLPTPRSPVTPFKFRRENVTPTELTSFWNTGRYQHSPRHTQSGYCPDNKRKMEDVDVPMIPRKQLEKFMPNIDIGPAAYVTPTSLMSARSGHRVTHDMLHSYDPYIGGMGAYKPATIDHDTISALDPNRVGLHPDTISSRARMYRWFRRGPFFNENHYFVRSALRRDGFSANPMYARVEAPLHEKVVRLASGGHLKSACEEYRRLAFIPPVAVFRALTAACISGGKIADAVAMFTDANRHLRYVGRDFEVFRNVLLTAIAADNADRVMWLINETEGTFTENVIIRARFTLLEKFDLYQRALEFLLDKPGTQQRAREVYRLMARYNMFNADLDLSEGARLRQELLAAVQAGGDALEKFSLAIPLATNSLNQAAKDAAEIVAKRMFHNKNEQVNSTLMPEKKSATSAAVAPTLGTRLCEIASDINALYILRLCRFLESEGSADLLAENRHDEFAERAEDWILQLSDNAKNFFTVINNNANTNSKSVHSEIGKAIPYLPKSRASRAINGNGEYVRIAVDPLAARSTFGAATSNSNRNSNNNNDAYTTAGFYYQPSQRFVEETFPSLDVDNASSKYLVRQPIHKEKVVELFAAKANENVLSPTSSPSPVIIHNSISPEAARYYGNRSSGTTTSSSSTNNASNAGATQQQQQQQVAIDPSMESHL